MNKKIVKILVAIIAVLMVCVIIINFTNFKNPFIKDNLFTADLNSSTKKDPVDDSIKSEDSNSSQTDTSQQIPVFQINELTESRELSYIVNSVTVTKEQGDFTPPAAVNDEGILTYDASGNITNNYSFVVVNLTVTNLSDKEQENSLNHMWLAIQNNQGVFLDDAYLFYCGELRSYDKMDDLDAKNYFEYTFAPNEAYTCNLVYTAMDEEIDGSTLFLRIFPSGAHQEGVFDEDTRYIQLTN